MFQMIINLRRPQISVYSNTTHTLGILLLHLVRKLFQQTIFR